MKKSKNLRVFYIFPLLYVVSVYLSPIFYFNSEEFPFLSYFMYAPFIFGVLNIIVSIKCCKSEYIDIMLNSVVLIKYSMIPFFVIGGILVFGSLLLSFIPVPFMIFFGPTMAFMECVIGWLILALEAPYTISYLCLSQKAGIRPKSMTILHSVCQFFFFLDVFDVMYLTLKERKWKKLTITLLVLMVVAVILFFLLLLIGILKLIF